MLILVIGLSPLLWRLHPHRSLPASAPAPSATTKGAICQVARRGRACQLQPGLRLREVGPEGAGRGWE